MPGKVPAAKKKADHKPTPTAGKTHKTVGQQRIKKKKRVENFNIDIYKVLKQAHPDCSIGSKAMGVLNAFVGDIFGQVSAEAGKLAFYSKKRTISSREIQAAVRLMLPGELAKYGVSDGTKAAVTK